MNWLAVCKVCKKSIELLGKQWFISEDGAIYKGQIISNIFGQKRGRRISKQSWNKMIFTFRNSSLQTFWKKWTYLCNTREPDGWFSPCRMSALSGRNVKVWRHEIYSKGDLVLFSWQIYEINRYSHGQENRRIVKTRKSYRYSLKAIVVLLWRLCAIFR